MSKALAYVLFALGLAYACLWWSYEQFYGHFKVSPQDVGLSPTGNVADLTGAALQLGIWLVILIALLAVVPTLAVAASVAAVRTRKAAPIAIAIVLIALSVFLYEYFVERWPGPTLLLCGYAVVAIVELLRRQGVFASKPGATTDERPRSGLGWVEDVSGTTLRPALGVFLAAAVIGIALIDLPSDAQEAAACVTDHWKSVTSLNMPVPGLHLPILNVHAQPARLSWLPKDSQRRIHRQVVYLGQSNGALIVYGAVDEPGAARKRRLQTSRIPAGDVIVTIGNDAASCPGVH